MPERIYHTEQASPGLKSPGSLIEQPLLVLQAQVVDSKRCQDDICPPGLQLADEGYHVLLNKLVLGASRQHSRNGILLGHLKGSC